MNPESSRACDVYDLARRGSVVEGELGAGELPRLTVSLARPDAALAYRIEGYLDDRGRPCAQLHLTGDLELECQRCNSPLSFQLKREQRFLFVASEEELNALPIESDEEVEPIVGSRSMDLAQWIEDEAILSLPLVPRHEDCHPRVPAGAAGAEPERRNPFAVLAGLKGGSKEG